MEIYGSGDNEYGKEINIQTRTNDTKTNKRIQTKRNQRTKRRKGSKSDKQEI